MSELFGRKPRYSREEYEKSRQRMDAKLSARFTELISPVDPTRTIGIGLDHELIERMERRLRIPGIVESYFTEAERAYCDTYGDFKAQAYAARWCAKETVAKALQGIPRGYWSDIEVVRTEEGAPEVLLHGMAQMRAQKLGVEQIRITLDHDPIMAGALCFIVRKINPNQ